MVERLVLFERVWYMGCALAFQAIEPSSNLGTRSNNIDRCLRNVRNRYT